MQGRKTISLLVSTVTLSLATSAALAKAYYPSAREMIKSAEFIAVVRLCEPVKTETRGNWTYLEVTDAHLLRQIKGKLPKDFKIQGSENFRCAKCHFPKGESMVFLKKDHELYVGQAWNISCLPIKSGKVAWFTDLNLRVSDMQSDTSECIKQIKSELKD